MLDLSRSESVMGNLDALKKCHVAVFGLGGVGGFVAEALVRSGVGELTIVDGDVVAPSNLNRQLLALNSTVGQKKVDVAEKRLLDINPDLIIHKKDLFFLPENASQIDFTKFDFVADAVDTVTAKLELAAIMGDKIISCMGTGNKLDPMALTVTDIAKTSTCPLARVMRKELEVRGISHVKVVYSTEEPVKVKQSAEAKKPIPASISFVPSVAGLIAAGEVIKHIIKDVKEDIQ